MPTEKRQRQKEGRRARLEAERKDQKRRQLLRRIVIVVVIAAVVVGSVYLLTKNNSNKSATTTSTSSTSTTVPASYTALQAQANSVAVAAGCPAAPATAAHPANTLHWPKQPAMTINTSLPYFATMKTTQGTLKIRLNVAGAPVNVNNFVFLANQGFYKCVTFHRVVPGFMNQGGDPTDSGSGGPGYSVTPNEYPKASSNTSHVYYTSGVVAMANSGPNTNGSQFFIMAKASSLSPQYTIIGQVVSGLAVVGKINVTGTPDNPTTGQSQPPKVINRILSVTISNS